MAKQCEQNNDQNYVVGRGRLFFDKFVDGCNVSEHGEHYFGNTPELSLSSDTETLDHYSSDYGLREKDLTVMLEHSRSGSFVTDNISAENLALFFLGDQSKVTQTQVTGAKEKFEDVRLGRYFQLGTSEALPMGVRNIENMLVYVADKDVTINLGDGDVEGTEGVTKVNVIGQVEYDLEAGRIYLEPTATEVKDGQQVIIQYDIQAQARELIIARNRMIYGSLRFLSANPVGAAKDFFWPKVMIQPDGDYALKGDDWQQIGFTFSVLRKNRKVEQVYIESAAARVAVPKPEPEPEYRLTLNVNPTSGVHGDSFTANVKATKDGKPYGASVSLLITGQGLKIASGESINKQSDPTTGLVSFAMVGENATTADMIGKTRALNSTAQSSEVEVTVSPKPKALLTIDMTANPKTVVDQTGEVTFNAIVLRGVTPVQGADVRFISDGKITWQFDKMTYTSDASGKVVAKAKPTLGAVPAGEFTFTGKAAHDGDNATSAVSKINVTAKPIPPRDISIEVQPGATDGNPTPFKVRVKESGNGAGGIPVTITTDSETTWTWDSDRETTSQYGDAVFHGTPTLKGASAETCSFIATAHFPEGDTTSAVSKVIVSPKPALEMTVVRIALSPETAKTGEPITAKVSAGVDSNDFADNVEINYEWTVENGNASVSNMSGKVNTGSGAGGETFITSTATLPGLDPAMLKLRCWVDAAEESKQVTVVPAINGFRLTMVNPSFIELRAPKDRNSHETIRFMLQPTVGGKVVRGIKNLHIGTSGDFLLTPITEVPGSEYEFELKYGIQDVDDEDFIPTKLVLSPSFGGYTKSFTLNVPAYPWDELKVQFDPIPNGQGLSSGVTISSSLKMIDPKTNLPQQNLEFTISTVGFEYGTTAEMVFEKTALITDLDGIADFKFTTKQTTPKGKDFAIVATVEGARYISDALSVVPE